MKKQQQQLVAKLLDDWHSAELRFLYERSCNITEDVRKLDEQLQKRKKELGLDWYETERERWDRQYQEDRDIDRIS